MLRPSDNLPMLSPLAGSVSDLQGRWWVAHTKGRFEKAFARDMLNRGVGYFLPLRERVKITKGRKRRSLIPLFPSYVFFCGTEEDRYAAKTMNRLCQTIEVPEQTRLIRELSNIERVISDGAQLAPYPFATKGRRCRVKAGPFQGLEGIVVQWASLARLVLQIHVLGQGVALDIEADLIDPV